MTTVPFASLLSGIGVGLAVAVPIGPMGVLCIQRTLAFGLVTGLATGLGAASVHLSFALIAALGLGATTMTWISAGAQGLAVISAGLLFWFGIKILRRTIALDPVCRQKTGWWKSYVSAFVFGLSNPVTILLFVAIMPTNAAIGNLETMIALTSGVFIGSIAWWMTLSTVVSVARDRLSAGAINLTNRVSGLTLAALGILMFANGIGLKLY